MFSIRGSYGPPSGELCCMEHQVTDRYTCIILRVYDKIPKGIFKIHCTILRFDPYVIPMWCITLQGGDESLRPIIIKTFPVLFVILWTNNTIIPTGDFSSIVWHYLRDSPRSSLQGEIILENFAEQIVVYDMDRNCSASMIGRDSFESLPSGGFTWNVRGMYDIYNGTNVIPHIERDEGTDT